MSLRCSFRRIGRASRRIENAIEEVQVVLRAAQMKMGEVRSDACGSSSDHLSDLREGFNGLLRIPVFRRRFLRQRSLPTVRCILVLTIGNLLHLST